MPSTLYQKHNYLNKNILYLKNTSIVEYDIHSAGTCILYELGLIKKETFNYLMSLEKEIRNIHVGNLLRDNPSWNKLQMEGFSNVMRRFMELNKIEDDDILTINKDSITLINKRIRHLIIDDLYEFRVVGEYNAYMYLNKKQLYINYKSLKFNTRGFGDETVEIQQDYFISFILSTMVIDSKHSNKQEVYNQIKNFRSQFLNKELEDEYYYDLEEGGYTYSLGGTVILTEYKAPDKNLYYLDNNYTYIEGLIKLLLITE